MGNPSSIRRGEHTFLVLDGLRGVAAISVMLYHYSIRMQPESWPWPLNAFLAVDFFFLLSGFVIAYAYEKRLLAGQTAGQFMLRRIIRLYPLYWIGMTLPLAGHVLTESLVKNSIILVPYITGILFLPSPYLASGELSEIAFPLNSAAWTLSLEIFINLIFALICRRLTTPRLIVLVALSAIGLAVALWVHGDPNLGWKWSTYFGGWARVTFSFFAGILLYRLFCLKKQAQLPAWIGAVLALILIADFSSTHMGHFYTLISCVIVFPATIWIGARTSAWEPLHRLYAWLGRTSYAVYITHLPLMGIYLYCAKRINIDARAHTTLAIALCAILSLGIASLLNAVYDTPIRAYLTKRLMPASQKRDIPGEHAPTGTGE